MDMPHSISLPFAIIIKRPKKRALRRQPGDTAIPGQRLVAPVIASYDYIGDQPRSKNQFNIVVSVETISDIKLIRTDTTLDQSFKKPRESVELTFFVSASGRTSRLHVEICMIYKPRQREHGPRYRMGRHTCAGRVFGIRVRVSSADYMKMMSRTKGNFLGLGFCV